MSDGEDADWLDDDAADGAEHYTGSALERQFRNLGYREGLTEEYEQTLQGGFNVGFSEGYTAGWEEAQLLGSITALLDVLVPAAGSVNTGAASTDARRVRPSVRFRVGKDEHEVACAVAKLQALAHGIEERLKSSSDGGAGSSGDNGNTRAATVSAAEGSAAGGLSDDCSPVSHGSESLPTNAKGSDGAAGGGRSGHMGVRGEGGEHALPATAVEFEAERDAVLAIAAELGLRWRDGVPI
eukprot:scaffold12362_cov124-Isochrysis_galbana.AAC.7